MKNKLYFHQINDCRMKVYCLFLLAVFPFISLSIFGQNRDSLLKIYNTQTIYRLGNKFIKGTTVLNYEQLQREFTTPQTLSLYFISRKKASVGRIFNLGSFAIFIASLFTKTNTLGSIGFIAGTGLFSLTGFYFQTESSMYVERALWEHNREILLGNN